MPTVPDVTLNNGVRIPQIGIGMSQVGDDVVSDVVTTAIEAGYRSIDTAASYGNEAAIGEAIRSLQVDRGELFVTSKLANTDHGYGTALCAFGATMDRLGLEYLDLYLIHWPLPARGAYVSTWKALEHLYAQGRVRAIGVSNFHIAHLRRVMDEGGIVPALNQIELHPGLPQEELRTFHAEHGIATEAWSPLGKGRLLDDPVIGSIAEEHGATPAQVVLSWHLQRGTIVIPKSATPERIRSNLGAFDVELADEDIEAISALGADRRFGPDPDEFNPI
ncbi:MAG: aldo/keto reductase [Nocardiopsaceae bacterium]|nr:aldo/keto reductase [Nocardiopsaceae bacterium]